MATMEKVRLTVKEYREQVPDDHMGIVELIDGEIVTTMPKQWHQSAVLSAGIILRARLKHGTVGIAPVNVYFEAEQYYEPDVLWVSHENDRCKLGDDGFWYGAPDLIIEVISPSSGKYDRVTKFRIYEKHGVREYWLLEPELRIIEVFSLQNGQFVRVGGYVEGESFESPLFGLTFQVSDFFAA